jgi:hypothetical protein
MTSVGAMSHTANTRNFPIRICLYHRLTSQYLYKEAVSNHLWRQFYSH